MRVKFKFLNKKKIKRKFRKIEKKIDLEDQILQIQKSTKTLMPFFRKLHNGLRSRSQLYYNWHLFKYNQVIHYAIASICFVLAIAIVFSSIPSAYAQTYTKTWSSYNDFNNNKVTVNSATTQSNVTLNGSGDADNVDTGSVTLPDQTPFSETFDTTAKDDTAVTNADWSGGQLKNSKTWVTRTGSVLFMDFKYINATTVIGLGSDGVYKSTDGGKSWAQVKSLASESSCYNMAFPNTTNGYISCVDNNHRDVLVSTDSGDTWTTKSNVAPNLGAGETVLTLTFSSATTGFMGGTWVNGSSKTVGWMYKTINSGSTWALVSNSFATQTLGGSIQNIFMISDSVGYAVGSSYQADSKNYIEVYKTTSGGASGGSWTLYSSGSYPVLNQAGSLNAIYFSDINNGYAAGYDQTAAKSLILSTHDGGSTWSEANPTGSYLYDVSFYSSSSGCAVGYADATFCTTDTGATWVRQWSGLTTDGISKIKFYNGMSSAIMADYTTRTKYWTYEMLSSVTAQSLKMNDSQTITKATLQATRTDATSENVDYFLSNNGGSTWEAVTLGQLHTFAASGTDLRWKAILYSSDGANSPIIDTITINYLFSGTLSGLKVDTGGTAGWDRISWNASTPANTSFYVQARSASTESGLASASWNNQIVNSGVAGNINASGTPNDRWLEIQLVLTGDGISKPVLNDFTVIYSINAAPSITINSIAQQSDGNIKANITLADTDDSTADVKLFYNDGTTILNSSLASDATSLAVNSADNLPNSGTLLLGKEIITYSGKSGTTLTNLTRGVASTLPASHDSSALIYVKPSQSVDNEGNALNSGNGNNYDLIWHVGSDLPNRYSNQIRIKIFADDNEAALNIDTTESDPFIVDTVAPVAGGSPIVVNEGVTRVNSYNITLHFDISDNSGLLMKVSDDQTFSGVNYASFEKDYPYTLSDNQGVKTIYTKFSDIYGNEMSQTYQTSVEVDTYAPPVQNFHVQDTTNADAGKYLATLTWSPLSNNDFAAYVIDRSVNGGSYSALTTIGSKDQYAYADLDLSDANSYSYKIRSRDDLGNLSDYSNSVTIQPGNLGDKIPPVISNVNHTADKTSATITWSTGENSDSVVNYGTTAQYGEIKGTGGSLTQSHSVSLDGLIPSTTYYFQVSSSDASGNKATSVGPSFMTLPSNEDKTAPVISSFPPEISTLDTKATFTWQTDEDSDTFIEFGKTTDYGTTIGRDELVKTHVFTIENLDASTTYHYRIKSRDNSGNQVVSGDGTFTTSAIINLEDKTPPQISDIQATPNQSGAIVTWTTNEPADSIAEFGKTTNYGSLQGKDELAETHSVTLVGLDSGTTFYFRIRSRDAALNLSLSSQGTFNTEKNLANDGSAPVITGATAQKPGADPEEVTIVWTTSKPATSQVLYGLSADKLDQATIEDKNLNTTHYVEISHLNSNTKYYYQAKSIDQYDNQNIDEVKYFVTSQTGMNAPKISGVEASDVTLNSAIISWQTTVVATSVVNYGVDINYGSKIEDESLGSTTIHTIRLKDLASGQAYHFRVTGQGADNSLISSDDYVFNTQTMPSISNIQINDIASDNATATWSTNMETDSYVDLGTSADILDKSEGRTESVKDHQFKLANLKPATQYFIRIKSRDQYGNLATSDVQNFRTISDTIPPIIRDLKNETSIIQDSSGNSKAQVIVSWSTDEPATSQIKYSQGVVVGDSYPLSTQEDTNLTTSHVIILSNLQPSSTYHLKIVSTDASGNIGVSDDYSVITLNQNQSLLQYIVQILEERFSWMKGFGFFQ